MTAIDYSSWPTRRINTTSIKLDDKNPRLSHLSSKPTQRQIIAYLLESEQILEVARSIAYKGYFPDELPIITEENDYKVVLEGNRRVAACKILINPNLAPDAKRRTILKLIKDSGFNIELIRKLKFLKAPTRASADAIIENRHAGVQIEKWDKIKQYRFYYLRVAAGETIEELASKFNKTRSVIRKSLSTYFMYVKALSLELDDDAMLALSDETEIGPTNLERFYETKEGKDFLKISFGRDGKHHTDLTDDEFDKRYKRIILDFLSKKLTSRTLNDAIARKRYMDELLGSGEFSENATKDKSLGNGLDEPANSSDFSENKEQSEEKSVDVDGEEVPEEKKGSKKKGGSRKVSIVPTLIPISFHCNTGNKRIDSIVVELQKLSLEEYPNAVCVLFRSLLDMALSQLLIKSKTMPAMKKQEAIVLNAANDKRIVEAYAFLADYSLLKDAIDEKRLKKVLGIKNDVRLEAPSLARMLDYVLRDDVHLVDNVKIRDAFRPYYSKKNPSLSHWDFNRFVHNEYGVLPSIQEFETLWLNVCHFLEFVVNKLEEFNTVAVAKA